MSISARTVEEIMNDLSVILSAVHVDTTRPNIEQTVIFQAVCELRCTIVVIKLVSDSHCIAIDIN